VACSSFSENVRGKCCIKFRPSFRLIHIHGQYGKPQLFKKLSSLGFIAIASLHKESTLSSISKNCDCSNTKYVSTVLQRTHKTLCCLVSVLAKLHSTTVASVQSGTRQAFLKEARFSPVTIIPQMLQTHSIITNTM